MLAQQSDFAHKYYSGLHSGAASGDFTILDEDSQTLLDQEGSVKDN